MGSPKKKTEITFDPCLLENLQNLLCRYFFNCVSTPYGHLQPTRLRVACLLNRIPDDLLGQAQPETQEVVVVRGVVVVAICRTAVPGVVVPTAPANHADGARTCT